MKIKNIYIYPPPYSAYGKKLFVALEMFFVALMVLERDGYFEKGPTASLINSASGPFACARDYIYFYIDRYIAVGGN